MKLGTWCSFSVASQWLVPGLTEHMLCCTMVTEWGAQISLLQGEVAHIQTVNHQQRRRTMNNSGNILCCNHCQCLTPPPHPPPLHGPGQNDWRPFKMCFWLRMFHFTLPLAELGKIEQCDYPPTAPMCYLLAVRAACVSHLNLSWRDAIRDRGQVVKKKEEGEKKRVAFPFTTARRRTPLQN